MRRRRALRGIVFQHRRDGPKFVDALLVRLRAILAVHLLDASTVALPCHPVELARHVPLHAGRLHHRCTCNAHVRKLDDRIPGRLDTREDFERHDADGPHVRRAFQPHLLRLLHQRATYLGRHITSRRYVSEQDLVADRRGRVEVDELPGEVRRKPHDVRRVQVAVNDPLRVQLRNSLQNLNGPQPSPSAQVRVTRSTE